MPAKSAQAAAKAKPRKAAASKRATPAKAKPKAAPASASSRAARGGPAAPAEPVDWAAIPAAPPADGWSARAPNAEWTPQQAWPPMATPPAPTPHPVQGLAGALVVLLAAVVGWAALNLALMVLVPGWGSPSGAEGPVAALGFLTGFVSFGLWIALVVVFCIWLYRVLANARSRHPTADITPGWAVGSFFIPFVQFLAPYFPVRRAWQADVSPDAGPVTAWFVPWSLAMIAGWAAGIFGAVVGFRLAMESLRTDAGEPDIAGLWEEFRPAQVTMAVISLALQAVAAFFLVRLARRWTSLQEGRPVS